MSDGDLVPAGKQTPSFEEFKKFVLQYGAEKDFLGRIITLHGKIPRLIRVLFNFDKTGFTSAIDQLISEEKSEREQDNILRAIYTLGIRIWNPESERVSSLSDDKFMFLYFVYVKSETDVFARVNTDEIQNLLSLPQSRTISIGEYLDKSELISFDNWYQGIKILHNGVVTIEDEVLGNNETPEYVSQDEIKKIEERVRLRFDLLQQVNREADEDTFRKISHADLAIKAGLDHFFVINQLLPYMEAEGWIKSRTADTISITEEGIDRVKALLSQKRKPRQENGTVDEAQ